MDRRSKVFSDRLWIIKCRDDVPASRHQIGFCALINSERLLHAEGVRVRVAHERDPLLGCASLHGADEYRGHKSICDAAHSHEALV